MYIFLLSTLTGTTSGLFRDFGMFSIVVLIPFSMIHVRSGINTHKIMSFDFLRYASLISINDFTVWNERRFMYLGH